MTLLRQTAAIAGKDLRVEVRGRHAASAVLPFAGTLLVALGLSLGPGRRLLEDAAPGLLWVAVLFASILSFRQAYQAEGEDGAMEGLLMAPIDKAAVFLGKAAAVTVILLLMEVLLVVLAGALFGLSLGSDIPALAAVFILGTVGLAAVGSLFGATSESVRAREAVFPLLVLPLATPVLVAGIRATAAIADGRVGEAVSWIGLLASFDAVFVAVGMLVFAHLLED